MNTAEVTAISILIAIVITTLIVTRNAHESLASEASRITGSDRSLPSLEWKEIEVPDNLCCTYPFDGKEILLIPEGFAIRAYARVPGARFLLALPDGNVLVSQPKFGKITLLKPPKSDKVGAESSDFAVGLTKPHDMVLYTDDHGKDFLYIAEGHQVTRHPYKYFDTKLRNGEVIADGLPHYSGFRHPLKNIAVGNGTVYLAIGSETNDDPEDLKQDPKRGAIYGYSLTGGNRRLVSEGIRNAEGLAFEPQTKELWVVVNQRDNVQYPYRDKSGNYGKVISSYVDLNPPEEFSKIVEGMNYGWPFCNPVSSDSMNDLVYVADVYTNPNESVVKCSTFRKVDKGMEPHSAPLGLTFWVGDGVSDPFYGGALVAMHGSWNRQSISGTKVVFFPWVNGRPGIPYDLVSGWVLDANKKERWGRPVDTAILKDGSVLISDDYNGAIYRLYKKR